jgi:hypothetical protein
MSARSDNTKRGRHVEIGGHSLAPGADLLRDAARTARGAGARPSSPPRELGLGPVRMRAGAPRTRRSPSRGGPWARAARRAHRGARAGARHRPPLTPSARP